MSRNVLVTGGAGFIGSHISKALFRAAYQPVVYDNLSTGHADAVRWGPLVLGDVADARTLRRTIEEFAPACIVHCAANAYVGESVENPRKYYANNVGGGLTLLETALDMGLTNIVFSSSCATYGVPERLPIDEESPQVPINPYGRTKLIFEMMLEDFAVAHGLRFVALRYFNAAGADPDGELRERHEPETHIIPRALLAAVGRLPHFEVFGRDYPTSDGTCVRDFIHVSDLAEAHVAAVDHLLFGGETLRLNLGSGRGTSVGEIIEAIGRITGRNVPVEYGPRRPGDPPILFAETGRASERLGFRPQFSDIDTIIRTACPTFGLEARI